jgi:hypothetical protein
MKNMKDPLAAVPAKARPYVLLVLALIPLLAVWAVYDDVVRRQSAEIERLRATAPQADQAQVPQEGQTPAGEPTIAPRPPAGGGSPATPFAAPTTDWRPVTSPDGKFQVHLPPGTKLVRSEGYTYVMADPTPGGAQPIMAIKIASAVDKQGFKPGGSNGVMIDVGNDVTYWLYTWQFKAWTPFERVVASFKTL